MRRIFNLWPPFLFSGIRVGAISDDWRHAQVELRERWYNRNYVGTHFGGSLFAMTDPFWMILVMQCLGRDYIVWDQAAEIEFVKPGRGTVHAGFDVDDASLDAIRAATAKAASISSGSRRKSATASRSRGAHTQAHLRAAQAGTLKRFPGTRAAAYARGSEQGPE